MKFSGSEKWRRDQRSKARRHEENVERGFLEAAKAEGVKGPPLVVDSLTERLAKAIPGARIDFRETLNLPWTVWRGLALLAAAHSEREAVERAIALFGKR